MTVLIHIPPFLQNLAGNETLVEVDSGTVGDCLEELVRRFPAVRERLFGEDGGISSKVQVFINGASAYPGELSRPAGSGDTITVTSVMVGG